MKRSLICALFFFFMHTGSGYAYKIHYNLKVVNPSQHTTQITMTISDFSKRQIHLEFDDSNYGVAKRLVIKKVEAYTNDRTRLKTVKERDRYLVLNKSHSTFLIRYQFTMNQRQNRYFDGPMGYLNQNYMLSKAGWTFLVSCDHKAEQYSVEFDLPEGWQQVTPWKVIGKINIENNYQRFIASAFTAGKFEIREKQIQGTKVRIAADTHYKKVFRETLFKNGFKIFAYLKSVFATQHPASHLSIFVKPVGEKEWQYINESGESHGEVASRLNEAYFQFEHRVFHTFNGFPTAGMRIQSGWFLEGVNEYYYMLSLLHLREERPFKKLQHLYFKEYLSKKDRWDAPLGSSKPQTGARAYFLNYQKGALVAYLLDRKIRKMTNGTKTLSHVLQDLYKEYGQYRKGVITEQVIWDRVSQIVKKDMALFFEQKINGTTPLKMEHLLDDPDQDHLLTAAEEFLGTDPVKFDSDGDGASDGIEYRAGTNPLSSDSKPIQEFYIDGYGTDWKEKADKIFPFSSTNQRCDLDLKEVLYRWTKESLYVLIGTRCSIRKNKKLRYYINVDLDLHSPAELHFAAMYQQPGDTSRFNPDWSTYGYQRMDQVKGLESAVNDVVEFRIPNRLLHHKNKIKASLGIWDISKNKSKSSTPWLVLNQ